MTIRTFWLILLKIIGIVLILSGVNVIIYSFSTFTFIQFGNTLENLIWMSTAIILTVFVYLFILWLFVFRTSWLIDRLHLEKGFTDERISLNASRSGIIIVAVIIVGGIMIIESLPELCKHIFTFLQTKSLPGESPSVGWITLYAVKATLGYFLMTNGKQIARFINKRM